MRSNRSLAWRTLAGVILATVVSGGQASAAPISVVAQQQTPALPGSFSLDFGFFGGVSSAQISQTDFELEIDADLGTAQFRQYEQFVAPLILPGGFSTGNIRVEVVEGSSQGGFDKFTGEFTTEELYAVHFDGDLSAFGLTSPVVLPSASSGTLTLSAVSGGDVFMDWTGISQLPNPFDPSSYIPFRYTCSLDAAFAAEPVTLLELALIPNVLNLSLPLALETSLMTKLDMALDFVNTGQNRRATSALNTFISRVETQRGGNISESDADTLVSDAQGVIQLLAPNGTIGTR